MGKKTQKEEPKVPDHVIQAFEDAQRKLEVIQGHLDKLQTKTMAEKKRRHAATVALRFFEEDQSKGARYYFQVGKAFSCRALFEIKTELQAVVAEVEKDLPKLYNAQAQFEIKKKEQYANMEAVAGQAKGAMAKVK